MRLAAHTAWSGSTAVGWESYDRAHAARAEPAKQQLTVTTAEARGNPDHLNPEQLVLMAASSCQMLWFLHLAARSSLSRGSSRGPSRNRPRRDRCGRLET